MGQKMRADTKAKHMELCDLIEKKRQTRCVERAGRKWAALSRKEWAEALNVSPPTITKLTQIPPIEKLVFQVPNKAGQMIKTTGLRIIQEGEKPVHTFRDMANIQRVLFSKRTNRQVSNEEWGCLLGLAENWPPGHQIDIFKWVISKDGWVIFCNLLDVHIDVAGGQKRFYEYPSITVLRRFHEVAQDAYKGAHFPVSGEGYPYVYDYV